MRRAWLGLCFATAALSSAAPPPSLAIVRATLHEQREDGPAVRAGYEYIPGELLYLSFRVSGYGVANDAVELHWQSDIIDPEGTRIVPVEHGVVNDAVTGNDASWLPKIQQTVALPPYLPAGLYSIQLHVADGNAHVSADQRVQFRVRGRALEKPGALALRALHFHRSEEDLVPLEPAVYAPGGTLWLRGDVVGFRLGEANAYDVEYSFAIYSGDKLLYAQPQAGEDHESTFYPKRWLSAIFSVSLNQSVAPGEYRIVLKAHDKLADTTVEQAAAFEVKR
jgi:hypothetical protein